MANLVVYKGRTYKVSDLSKIYGIPSRTINRRLRSGWSVDDAVETSIQGVNQKNENQLKKETAVYDIYFTTTIPSILEEMQPLPFMVYKAEKIIASEKDIEKGIKCEDFYIIYLSQNRPLIVYDGEFSFVTEQTQVVAGMVMNPFVQGDSNANFLRLWNT